MPEPTVKFSVGDLVDYHSVIGGPVTEFTRRVLARDELQGIDRPVYWIEGKQACVAEESLTPAIFSMRDPLNPDKEPLFWGFADDERLVSEVDEVMERWIDDAHPTPLSDLEPKVLITGFAPMEVRAGFLEGSIIEDALESLDCEFANPNGEYTVPTDAMKEAEAKFIAAVLKEYMVWSCEPVCTITVSTMAWIQYYCPRLLEES